MLQRKKTTPRPNECCNIPLTILETVLNQSCLFAEVLLIYHYIFAGKTFLVLYVAHKSVSASNCFLYAQNNELLHKTLNFR